VLAATARWLYLGFDCENGVQLFRAASHPAAVGDFRGRGGCAAGTAGCEGIGGAGFGDDSGATRFLDAEVLSADGAPALHVVVGSAGRPLRVLRIAE
jgi:hypothetical protein